MITLLTGDIRLSKLLTKPVKRDSEETSQFRRWDKMQLLPNKWSIFRKDQMCVLT